MLLILLIISVNANLKSESILGENGCYRPDSLSTFNCGGKSYQIISCNTSYCEPTYEMRGIKCVDGTPVITENLDKAISVNFCRKPEKGYATIRKDTAAYIEINLCYENPTFFNTKTMIFKSSNKEGLVYYYDFSGPTCSGRATGPWLTGYTESNIPPTSKYVSLYGYENCDFSSYHDIVGTVYFNTSEELTINKCKINENNYYEEIYCGLKYVESDGKCLKPCLNKIDHCTDCDDNDFSKCSECESNYMVSNGECVLKCDINCKTCDGPNQCSECYSNYKPKDGVCIECNINNCLSCSSKNYCDFCSNGYHPENGECVENKIVYDCDVDNCLSCSDNNYCETCKTNYHTSYGECKPDCNIDKCSSCSSPNYCDDCYFGYHINDKGGCDLTCNDPNCKYCTTSAWTCDECNYPYITKGGECELPNPQQSSNNQESSGNNQESSGNNPQPTIECDENCKSCVTNGQCNECNDGYYLKEYKVGNKCYPCKDEDPHCNNCYYNNGFQCSDCMKDYLTIYDKNNENGICEQCNVNGCEYCYHDNSNNIKCKQCKQNYILENGKCEKCTLEHCKLCDSDGYSCEECEDGYDGIYENGPRKCIKHQSSSDPYNPDNSSLSLMILLVAILLLLI